MAIWDGRRRSKFGKTRKIIGSCFAWSNLLRSSEGRVFAEVVDIRVVVGKMSSDDADKERLGVLIILGNPHPEASMAPAKLLRILLNYCLCA